MRREDIHKPYIHGKVNLAQVNPAVEVFFDIPGWPGYKISNMKNVYSEKSKRLLKQYQTYPGKPQKHVKLKDFNGKIWLSSVQKLFWKTFYKPRNVEKLRKT